MEVDWIALGIAAATIIFSAGVYVTIAKKQKEEICALKNEMQAIREHNSFQDKQLAESNVTSQVILTKLEYIQISLDELKTLRMNKPANVNEGTRT